MLYAAEIDSGVAMYIKNFHEDWFRHSKVDGVGYTDNMVIA
jgi:hypothetical protein